MISTPILLIIFNRPSKTREVFEAIRKVKPSKLYIAADGPKENDPENVRLCEESRSIVSDIDWPCDISTRFQKNNMGCKYHVSSAITWFFEHVDEGIILEDDCLPNQSFFSFTSLMLDTYRNNLSIMHISGVNFNSGKKIGDGSYFFSNLPHIWGWATWKRAWNTYEVNMGDLERYVASKKIFHHFPDHQTARFWISHFKHIKRKNVDTWDAQWAYAIIKNEGLCIVPNVNLIQNIGTGGGTHTSKRNRKLEQKACSIGNIIHPLQIEANKLADCELVKNLYIRPWYRRILDKLNI